MKKWLVIATLFCLAPFTLAYSAEVVAIIQNHSETQILVNLSESGVHAFVLSHPTRLVIDKNRTAKTQAWVEHLRNTAGVSAVRSALKPNHRLRIVAQISPRWKARSYQRSKQLHFMISPSYPSMQPAKKNRWTEATSLIMLKPINEPGKQPRARTDKKILILLDPGHGGVDPGATGYRGHHEKKIVLGICRQLAAIINSSQHYRALLTRTRDRYVPLRKRLSIARKLHPNLFISIHADAFRNARSRGVSVFALSQRGATSEAARWLARKENASELVGGVTLQDKSKMLQSVLINLSQTVSIKNSLSVGQSILHTMAKKSPLHHRHVEQAAFVVLKSPDIPSLLIETGFLSNKQEERKLANTGYQRALAQSIFQGIRSYYKK